MVERLEERGGSPIPPKSCRIEGEIRKVFGTEVRRLPIVCAGLDHTEIVDSATKKDNRVAQRIRSQVLAIRFDFIRQITNSAIIAVTR
jgi:hypothetical protein